MNLRRCVLGTTLVVGIILALAAPTAAWADSGSITNVHAVGSQLEASFSATSTECGEFYCGWFPYARQIPATAGCTPGDEGLVWVGQNQDNPGTQTATVRFYPSFTPTKLCLLIFGVGPSGDHVVAQATYTAPPPPGPTLLSPAPDASLRASGSISFTARGPSDADSVWFEISRSSSRDPDGTLADTDVVESGPGSSFYDGTGTYEYDSELGWSKQPGTYYWQAYRIACDASGTDCAAESEIRRLTILPPPLRLVVFAPSPQPLRRPRPGNRYNNLVHRVRCSVRCTLRTRTYPTFRRHGRRVRLRGFTNLDTKTQRGGRTYYYGYRFTRAGRRTLTRVMRRYGPLRWTLRFTATDRYGSKKAVTKRIRMLPPPRPKPKPSPPPPSCDPSYPTVCIPPYPPDLDCDQIRYHDFVVRGSDPHGFDNDNDGVGCET